MKRDTPIRTSLQKHVPYTPMKDDELRRKAAELWKKTGTVMIKPEWLKNDIDKAYLNSMGTVLFGDKQL